VCVREGIAGVELFLALKYWPVFDSSIIFGGILLVAETNSLFFTAWVGRRKLTYYFQQPPKIMLFLMALPKTAKNNFGRRKMSCFL
jgi:ABC-type polysaccharide transport system permease subunit